MQRNCNIYKLFISFRLAAHMAGYKCFQIELTRGYDYSAFREDLKKLYYSAGLDKKHTVFLFTDTQVGN
jgi:dynein heavy chain